MSNHERVNQLNNSDYFVPGAPQSAFHIALKPRQHVESEVPRMRGDSFVLLRGIEHKIGNAAVPLSVDIGANEMGAGRTSVLAEIAFPADYGGYNYSAIVRLDDLEDEYGRSPIGLVGYAVNEETRELISGCGGFNHIPYGGSLLVGREFDTVQGVFGANVVSGRLLWGKRFSDKVSRRHLEIRHEPGGSIAIRDTSTNGTKVRAPGLSQARRSGELRGLSNYHTGNILRLFDMSREDIPGLRFEGRQIITHTSEVGGELTRGDRYIADKYPTIDIRSWSVSSTAEAIIVDATDPVNRAIYKRFLDEVYTRLDAERFTLERRGDPSFELKVLRSIYLTVVANMPYDHMKLGKRNEELQRYGSVQYRKINVARYMQERSGVCRHQALVAAWLAGEMKTAGYLTGRANVDNNFVPTVGAHAWMRYEHPSARPGKALIIDPAQGYFGSLGGAHIWPYFRESDPQY